MRGQQNIKKNTVIVDKILPDHTKSVLRYDEGS